MNPFLTITTGSLGREDHVARSQTGDRIAEKAYARNKKLDVLQYLRKYAQERLCVRLWAHEEGSNLSLKGGAAHHFAPEFLDLSRPTADIDVRTYKVMAHDEIVSLFRHRRR